MSLAPVPRSGAEVVALLENAFAAHHQVVMARGFDPFYGRRVAGELRARGLAEVGAEGRLFCWEGGVGGRDGPATYVRAVARGARADGGIAADELAATIRLLDDASVAFLSQATVAVWARRAAG